jgi:hypothetical protein
MPRGLVNGGFLMLWIFLLLGGLVLVGGGAMLVLARRTSRGRESLAKSDRHLIQGAEGRAAARQVEGLRPPGGF